MIALEPTAIAQQRIPQMPGQINASRERFIVQVVGNDLPSDGYLDRFHTGKDALANSKPGFWKCNLPIVGQTTRCDDATPNIASLMYAMRNTAVEASLERQIGIRYLIGGDYRAQRRFDALRRDFFEHSWFGKTGLFDGKEYSPDFKIPQTVKTLYLGSPEHAGKNKGNPVPNIAEYISWLENPVADPMQNDAIVRQARMTMVPALIERALAMTEADAEFKYYTSDYLQDYRVRSQFIDPYVAQRLKNRSHQPSPYELAKVGDVEAVRAQTDAEVAYRKLTVEPAIVDQNGTKLEFPVAPLLQGSRMEIAAILAFKQAISDNPLLVAPIKGKPLYEHIHELISKIPMRDPDTGGELKVPDPKESWVAKDAKLIKQGEKIPPPTELAARMSKVRRFLKASDAEKPYRYILESREMMAAFDDLIDSALLTYLFATKQLINQVTERVDWDGDIRTEWGRLVQSDAIYNRAVADYSYLYRAAAKRAPASEDAGAYVMHVDFPEARKHLLSKVERRQRIMKYVTYSLDAIVTVCGIALMFIAPETSPLCAWMGVFRSGWLLVFELGALAMTNAFVAWKESDISRQIVRNGYLAVPSGSDEEVQNATRMSEANYHAFVTSVIMLGALPAFKQLVSIYRGIRAAQLAVEAEKLAAADAAAEEIIASGRSLGGQGRKYLSQMRDVIMKTGLMQKLPRLWAFLKDPIQGATEHLGLGSNFMQVFRSEMMADLSFQLGAEVINRRTDIAGDQLPDFLVDMVNGAVMTALMVVLAFKAPTLNGRPLPTDFTQPLEEMDPEVVKMMGGGWKSKDRVAGFLLNSFRYCAVGYASGVAGGAITKTVENWKKPMSDESVQEAFRELNREGWFLCNFAWAWSQPRMQAQNVWRRNIREKYGVTTEWGIDPVTKQYGQNLKFPEGWTPEQIKSFNKVYARPSQVSNAVSTLTWPWLARTTGVQKKLEFSDEIDEIPDAVYYKVVERVDPVGALFAPMANLYPFAPLPKERGREIPASASLVPAGPPAMPAPTQRPRPQPVRHVVATAQPVKHAATPAATVKHTTEPTAGSSSLDGLWSIHRKKRKN